MAGYRSRLELWPAAGGKTILAAAKDIRVREVVNGDYYVQFIYPKQDDDDERYAALAEDNEVAFPRDVENGQRFRIRSVEEKRQGQKIFKIVEAHHVAFTLGNYFLDDYIDFAAARTLPQMLTMLGAGTPFTFVVEGNFPAHDIFDFGEDTKFNLLQFLRRLYDAELSFDNYTITLTTRKGGNYGARIRYRHNMVGIKRKSHDMERITRLYGYGKNGLTIEGLPGHSVKYIDSPYFDLNNPFMGKMEWPEIEDKNRLLQEMQKHLAKYELPAVSYDAEFVQMEKVDREYLDERIREAGDTVTCYDGVLGYSFDARANEFERYPFDRKRGRAVLTNFREFSTADYIFQATVGSKKAIEYTSKNAVLKGQKYDDSITLVDGLGMLVSDDFNRQRVRLGQVGPGDYGIAMFNKAGDKTIWQDASTGDARFTGIVTSSAFVGGTIAIGSGNNIFMADTNGIYLGHANFASAPFSVTPAGRLKALNGIFGGELQAASGTFNGTVSAGAFIGGYITGTIITGSMVQTASAGIFPRTEMSNTSYMFKVESSGVASIEMRAVGSPTSVPYFRLANGNNVVTMTPMSNANIGLYIDGPALHAELTRITLRGYSGVYFLGWSSIQSEATGQSLQQALDSKASQTYAQSLDARITALGG